MKVSSYLVKYRERNRVKKYCEILNLCCKTNRSDHFFNSKIQIIEFGHGVPIFVVFGR